MVLILIIIAGIAKALLDTIQFHFETSIFKDKNPYIWNPTFSWKNKYIKRTQSLGLKKIYTFPMTQWVSDVWHITQSIYLLCFFIIMGTLYTFPNDCKLLQGITLHPFIEFSLYICVMGTLFNLVFDLFFNKIFKC